MAKISNEQFRELNAPVSLYSGQINHWVIVVRRADLLAELNAHGETAALSLAGQVAADWWRQVIGPQATADFRATGVMPAEGLPQGQRLQHVQPWPIEFSDAYVYVSFEFEPKGKLELDWPWQTPLFGSWDEPLSGLIATYKPHQVIDVPDSLDTLGDTLDDIKEDAAKIGDGLKVTVALGVTVALLVMLASKRNG